MPTPSINIDTVQNAKGNMTYTDLTSGNSQTYPFSNVGYKWEKENRPASSSPGVISPGHFKRCGGWQHSGRRVTRSLGTVTELLRSQNKVYAKVTYDNGGFWTYGPEALDALPFGLLNRSLSKALDKLKAQDVHLGNMIAEGRRTVSMVANAARSIASQVIKFRRRHPDLYRDVIRYQTGSCPRRLWGKIPDKWLELQYGWLPLMSDIMGISKRLSKKARDSGALVHVTGYAEDETNKKRRITSTVSDKNFVALSTKTKHQVWQSLYFTLGNPAIADLSSLGLLNPAEIVWELIPFSFVVDWFIPVGGWLSNLTADAGFNFVSGSASSLSRAKERVDDYGFAKFNDFAGFNVQHNFEGAPLGITNYDAYAFSRVCYASSPWPGIYFKNPLSTTHALNAIALLSQAFRKRL